MLNRPRIIPVLSIYQKRLVKTIGFQNPRYLGDPLNTLRIFNNKGVDELCVLDIRASLENREPNFEYLKEIAGEAFMPLSYGGGINSIEHVKKLLYLGFEKVVFNSAFYNNSELIMSAIEYAGSQSVVLSIDVHKDLFGRYSVFTKSGTKKINIPLQDVIKNAINIGIGELIINSIDKDGCMNGYDINLLKLISESTSLPVVICGGAGTIAHLKEAIDNGAHAVAAGSMFVYYGRQKGVLINFPSDSELKKAGIFQDE